MFQEILIDLPVGEYFRKFIDSIIEVLSISHRDRLLREPGSKTHAHSYAIW